jgi:hypothetical protein
VTRARALVGASSLAAGLTLAAGLALAPPARAAATCARPDVLDTVPPDTMQVVPPNASLFAHYDPSADYANEDVVLTPKDGAPEAFAAGDPLHPDAVKWDGTQGLLSFTPPGELPEGDYAITWPGLRGLNTATPGLPATVHFSAGTADDVAPPEFAGLIGVTWDLERKTNDCTDSLENRLVFTLALAPAADDGGHDGLTLVVFQSAGSGIDAGAGPRQVLTTLMPPTGKDVVVKLPVADATGHVCFAAIARDLTGKISSGGSQTVCVETTAPPFFRSCAVAGSDARGRGGAGAGLVLGAFALVLAARRRRRGRARAA